MESMKRLFDKFLGVVVRISSTKVLNALKNGFVATMPITLIGSMFLLVANLPFPDYGDFMAGVFGANWNIGLNQIVGATFDILAIATVIAIASAYAKAEKVDSMSCGLLALVSFLIVTASSTLSEDGVEIGGVIPKNWTNAQGIISAIIVGLFVGAVFTFFMKRKITIKMPDGVPAGVMNAFAALIPGFVIILISGIVYQVLMLAGNITLTELIFNVLQTPMQSLSDTWLGGLVIVLLISILFWAGLHGPNIVMGVMAPILTANAMANSDLLAKTGELSVAAGAHIMTPQIIDCFVKFGGTGITLGLLIAALLRARSKEMKSISKLSLLPGIFNINEPVIFGLPIVYNPMMLIPFIAVPVMAFVITYGATALGILTPFIGVQVPWTMPFILSGFILGGFSGAVIQAIILALSVAIYYPFMKAQDDIYLNNEKAAEAIKQE